MKHAIAWMCVFAAVPASLAAQGPVPTPASCSQDVSTWYTQAMKAVQEAARQPGAKPANYAPVLSERTDRIKACAARFRVDDFKGAALLDLASLYTQAGADSLAKVAIDRRLADAGLSEREKSAALVAMIRALTKADTLLVRRAEPYMARLDSMSDGVIMDKLSAHSNLNGEYRYLDVNDRIRYHSLAMIALGRRLRASAADDRSAGAVSPFTLISAYVNLGEVYADFGHVDSTFRVLDRVRVDHPEIPDSVATAYIGTERERYQLVGRPAAAITAGHWLNAAAGATTLVPAGKVTVIEFTAHWCIPCRNSYPSMVAMADSFGKRGVQFAFATEFYGYIGARKNLDAAAEFEGDREYFVGEHDVRFPIGIEDQRPPYRPGQPFPQTPNNDHYKVGGIPQTVIIDRNGVIRRILTGWDTGNAARIPALLNALLAERPARQTP